MRLITLKLWLLDLKLNENKERTESPQIIFESINATGKPLSTADLLRNYLLLGIDDSEQERYYKDYWLIIEKGIGDANISDFINKYLIMKIGDNVNKNTEYAEFKKYLSKNNIDAIDALKDLAHYAKYYGWIQEPEKAKDFDKKVSLQLENLRELKTASMAPLLLFLLEKADDDAVIGFNSSELLEALLVLESWAFRARVVGSLTSGAFNTISSTSLLNNLKRAKDDDFHNQIRFELSNYRTYDIWPNDNDFMESFKKYNFYKNYNKYVQRKLENAVSNDHHNWRPDSIEHIMPETLSADWKKRLGENYSEIHGEYLHTIGNLTPLNMTDNIINSNDPFSIKLPQYKSSSWKLTRDVYDDFKDTENWGVAEINSRAENLAYKASKIWFGPMQRERQIEADVKKKTDDYRRILAGKLACETIFYINYEKGKGENKHQIDAKMRIEVIDDKPRFIVMAGSRIFPYALEGMKPMFEDKIRKCGWHDEVVLEEDINIFETPSAASCFVVGGSSNGWTWWMNGNGETLDEIVADDLERSYEE